MKDLSLWRRARRASCTLPFPLVKQARIHRAVEDHLCVLVSDALETELLWAGCFVVFWNGLAKLSDPHGPRLAHTLAP
jgi:hypothetical protein